MTDKVKTLSVDQAVGLVSALIEADRLADAEATCREVLRMAPDDARFLNLLGWCAARREDWPVALDHFRAAEAIDPGHPIYGRDVGTAFHYIGDVDAAISQYKRIADVQPRNPYVRIKLAEILRRRGQLGDALSILRELIDFEITEPFVLFAIGQELMACRANEEAVTALSAAIELKSDESEFHHARAVALYELAETDRAEVCLDAVIEQFPQAANLHLALGSIKRRQGDLDNACRYLENARLIQPDNPMIIKQLAAVHSDLGNVDQALSLLDAAIVQFPDEVRLRYNRARLLISIGDVEEGYREYETWRWPVFDQGSSLIRFDRRNVFPYPKYSGESLEDRRLLIWSDKGIGEEINMAGLIPFVKMAGASCTFECDARLSPLFRRSFPWAVIVDRRDTPAPELADNRFDYQTPLVSLAQWFHPGSSRVMSADGYLSADQAKVNALREKYSSGDGRRLVGFSWATANKINRRLRSIKFTDLAPILTRPDIRPVSLQYGDRDEVKSELSSISGTEMIFDESIDPLIDMDGFATQIAALDLVITIDNSTAHLAGALGTPVWTLLHRSPDVRWQRSGANTPWYPSMRLFRQREGGDWQSVIENVNEALDRL